MAAATDQRHDVDTTVRSLRAELTAHLASSCSADEARRDATDILAAVLGLSRGEVAHRGHIPVSRVVREGARAAAAKRSLGAPLAYCVGTAAFRSLTLAVDERVLIPRPETEQLVDVALTAHGRRSGGVAIDVGTGSGAIALALATEGSFDAVIGTDVSADALTVARRNLGSLGAALRAHVEWRHGHLLDPVADVRPALIVSNPPYIAYTEASALPTSVRDWEPPIALFSADGGLRVTAQLVRQAARHLAPGGTLALEVDARRADAVAGLARGQRSLTDVRVLADLAGRERFVVARKQEEA